MKRQDLYNKCFSLRAIFQFFVITNTVTAIFVIVGLFLTQKKDTLLMISSSQSISPDTITSVKKNVLLSTHSKVLPNQSLQSVEFQTNSESFSKNLPPVSFEQPRQPTQEIIYKFLDYPNFKPSKKLQSIVDNVVNLAQNKNLSTKEISISLIDVNTGEIAGYQENKLRFPASVAKLFWMVALYNQFENGITQDPGIFSVDLYKMMKESDNEAASAGERK